jgi:hypothetical protein
MRLRTTFLWTMIVSFALAAAMGIIAILYPDLGHMEEVLGTSLLVGAFSLTSLACAFVLDRGRLRLMMWVGIAASCLSLAHWVVMIWFDPWSWSGGDWDDFIAKSGTFFTVLAGWAAHFGLLSLLRIDRRSWRLVRTVTLVVSSALAVSIVGVVWTEEFEEWAGKLIAVLSILTSCGTVVTPILALIEKVRRKDEPAAMERRITVKLVCPRCGIEQTLRSGRDKCTGCGLSIGIDIEEPRCHCGYLLYRLEGDVCPECGRRVDAEERWAEKAESRRQKAES